MPKATLVQPALDRLMAERTTLVTAHRLATVLKCDRVLVMDQGRIVEQGSHDQLVAAGGLYARLARMQFEIAHGFISTAATPPPSQRQQRVASPERP